MGAAVSLRGFMLANGTSTTNQSADILPFSDPASTDPDLANAVVTNAASAAAAIARFRTVNSNAAAGVYWYYTSPVASYDLGVHRAFGDAPVGARPTSGIAQYNYVGGTTPTDNYGRPGTFFGSNLTMNFSNQTVATQIATVLIFTSNAAMPVTTTYSIAPQTFSMGAGVQVLTGVVCSGCPGVSSGLVNGQFLGTTSQGFAASVLVRNTQLNTVNTANAGGNVSVYAKQ